MNKNIIFLVGLIISLFISKLLYGVVCNSIIGVLVQTLIYISLLMLLMILSRKSKLSIIIINIIVFIFSTISFLKLETRCEIFEPWDLVFVSNAGEFINFISLNISYYFKILLDIVMVVVATICEIKLFEKYFEIPKGIKAIVVSAISIISLIFFATMYMDIEMKYVDVYRNGLRNHSGWAQLDEYGALSAFIIDIGIMNNKPIIEGYSEESINNLYSEYESYVIGENAKEYDNVIMVLMESYFDVTKIEELSFEKDPLENFHKYSKEFTSNEMIVPNIGGGTANTEFKAITMFSTDQYSAGMYPYIHFINRNVELLPRIFKENGYKTTGIHSYNKGFYRRYKAYPYIGIDNYISDEDFENPEMYGNYIADIEINNVVKNIIESEEKSYITISTMGTHSPYTRVEYDEYEEWISNDKLSKTNEKILNNYIQSLRKADEMVGDLIEYVKNSEESTLLIIYGDHFPLCYEPFEDLGVLEKNENNLTYEKYPELFKTPYIVVSNVEKIESKGLLTPSKLGLYILENVKFEEFPWYYKVIYDYLNYDKNELKNTYIMLQYDEMLGKKYWEQISKKY